MTQIPYQFTLAAIYEKQQRITEKCYQQHLELLRNRVCATQQEYRTYKLNGMNK